MTGTREQLAIADREIAGGQLGAARARLERLAAAAPADPAVAHALAGLLVRSGDRDAAIPALRRADALAPSGALRATLGALLNDAGDHAGAAEACRQALALEPRRAEFHYNLANALNGAGDTPGALKAIRRAVELKPDFALALNTLGALCRQSGQLPQALGAFQRSVASDPGLVAARLNLGATLAALGDHEAALPHLEVALGARPGHLPTVREILRALAALGRFGPAEALALHLLAAQPDATEILLELAAIYVQGERREQAVECLRRVLASTPDHSAAMAELGAQLLRLKRPEEALPLLRAAMAADPDLPYVRSYLLEAARELAQWADYPALVGALVGHVQRDLPGVHLLTLFAACDDPALHRLAAQAYAARVQPVPAAVRAVPAARRDARPTVVYISPDFGDHPVGYSIVELLERHDRARWRIVGVSLVGHAASALHPRLRAACEAFHDADARDPRGLARLLADMAPDILVDLAGHTTHTAPAALAARPARVQVNYLGFPGTLGAPWIDYLLADRTVVPADAEAQYTESLACLPHSFFPSDTRAPVPDPAPTRAQAGLPDDAIVLCAFVKTSRLSPDVFDAWLGLLRRHPSTVLWLQGRETAAANLRSRAQEQGVDPGRLVFAARVPDRQAHLARHALADLFLDVFPYNAHSTGRDALWAGLPVLTLCGHSFASRVGASLLRAAKLEELVTDSLAAYVARADELIATPAMLRDVRERALAARRGALFDTARLASDVEWAYRHMLERAASKLAHHSFEVPAER